MICRPTFANSCLLSLLGSLVLLWQTCAVAIADGFQYAGRKQTINACVLVSSAARESNGVGRGPDNTTPHLFYVLPRSPLAAV